MTIEVIGSVYTGKDKDGDFNWMIQQPQYADALFVFNDNEQQYTLHHDHPTAKAGCSAGGGNAIIRPYQCQTPPRASGVPTGPDYDTLTPQIQAIIDQAVATVGDIAVANNYSRIFYSADANGNLGTGIFVVGDDVKAYIVTSLKALGSLP
jgi:hypothetical protein